MSTRLTIVVPVYNEGENFREWYRHAEPHLPDGSVVRVVYDMDEDDTLPVAEDLRQQGAPIEALKNTSRGARPAVITGLRSVKEGAAIVSMADLCDDLSLIPAMLRLYEEGAAVVVASRYVPGGKHIGGPLLKGLFSRWGSLALHWLSGFPAHDASNNFRLYASDLVKRLDLAPEGGFEIAFEITVEAWIAGEQIAEIPCTWTDRVRGESRFRLVEWLPGYARIWFRGLAHGNLLRRFGRRKTPR